MVVMGVMAMVAIRILVLVIVAASVALFLGVPDGAWMS